MAVVVVQSDAADLTTMAWQTVRATALERGVRLVEPSQLRDDADPTKSVLLAVGWTPEVRESIRQGVRPGALVSFEAPVGAWELYYNLERISGLFPHTFMFEGARERVAPTTRFHPLYVPTPCPPPRPTGLPWSNRRFLVAIYDNQAMPRARDLARWFDRPRKLSLSRTLAGLRYRPIARDRFQARLRAFEAFSEREDFDLYGNGWDRRDPAVAPELHAAAVRACRGHASDVLPLLARYRFALVYEDTRFSGYVSERILECFFARCIPIYSGAPDVAQYVPPSAFIDVRQFVSFPELERFLRRMTEDDARRYVEAAHAFLTSPTFESWCVDHFARDLVDALMQVAEA